MSFSLEPCLSALPQCRAVVLMSGPGLSWPQLRWSWLKWGCAPGKLCSVGLKNWAINGQALAKWHYNYTSVLLTYSNSNIGWKKKTWPCFWWHCLPANWTANLRWKLDIKMETKIKWKLGFYCIFGHAQIVIYTRMSFKNIEGRREYLSTPNLSWLLFRTWSKFELQSFCLCLWKLTSSITANTGPIQQ